MRKTVSLIGRPNTGKSSLINRLINEKKSIIDDQAGVTRDRIYGIVNYEDKSFNLIDTGGIDLEKATFNENIKSSLKETRSSDGKTITYTSTGDGYDNATYSLTIKIDTIQYDQANNVWK